MRKSSLLMAAAALSLAAALPARAAVHEMGAVNVSSGHFTHVVWSHFGAPLYRVTLLPGNDTIDCDHITVNYLDGTSHDVFSGVMQAGSTQSILFPPDGNDGRIANVNFSCRAQNVDGARIALSAVTREGGRVPHVTVFEDGQEMDEN